MISISTKLMFERDAYEVRRWAFERAMQALANLPQQEQAAVMLKWGKDGIIEWNKQTADREIDR